MSFSWESFNNNNKKLTPSPTLRMVLSNQVSRKKIGYVRLSMKKISLFISEVKATLGGCGGYVKGSMTVEASLLLPLLLFFFLHLMGYLEILRLHSNLTFGLWECGKGMAVYSAVAQELADKLPDTAVSYLYVDRYVEQFLGKDYLENSPLVQGAKGLTYLNSSYENGYLDIGVTYQVKPPISIFPFPYMRMVNHYYAKDWSGYEINPQVKYVYVTIYGSAWHANINCSHLYITVEEADWSRLKQLRNVEGRKYYPCELCEETNKGEKVYYTPYGSRYHKDKECSSLVRYIRAVLWQENMVYTPCSRCVEKEK